MRRVAALREAAAEEGGATSLREAAAEEGGATSLTGLRGHPSVAGLSLDALVDHARRALDSNWTGSSTVPSRWLYPHQWSWDTAFVAIGRSLYDEDRARTELKTLFDAQWANGMVPHVVFDPAVPDDAYFPGPDFWRSRVSSDAPRTVATSGITQPPIHARAVLEMHRHARDVDGSRAFLRYLYPRLVAQHDYLAHRRDPARIGLPAIVHPWESGLDDSPVWDRVLAEMAIPPGGLPRYHRADLDHADAVHRPTDRAYDTFVYLAAGHRDTGYDDDRLWTAPFLMAGPMFTAIHLWSTHALAEIARIVGADPRPHVEAADRIHVAMLGRLWDGRTRRFLARNLVTGDLEAEETIVSFAPLLDPALPDRFVDAIVSDLESVCFHPGDRPHFVVPTSSVRSLTFDRRRYWRGPVWLNTNWLLAAGLRQHGRHALADEIVASSLELAAGAGLFEYFDPFSGRGYGSRDFGWTASLAIDFARQARP